MKREQVSDDDTVKVVAGEGADQVATYVVIWMVMICDWQQLRED